MKKILKTAGIFVAVLLALLVVVAVFITLFFPVEKVKNIAISELSKALHREVTIEKASFNIFTGLKLEKLSISNRSGYSKKPFISADAIELRYDLWPLLMRKVVIRAIGLNKPEILIEMSGNGQSNFSDMFSSQKPADNKKVETSKPSAALPFALFINSFFIKDGKLVYSDRSAGSTSSVNNLDLNVSGFELTMSRPIDIKLSADVVYQGKPVPIALQSRIQMDISNEKVRVSPLELSIAGEKANASISVSGFKAGPSVDFTLSSKKISVDPLLAIFAGPQKKTKTKEGDMQKMIDQLTASIPSALKVKGLVDISNLTFQNFLVDKINVSLSLVKKNAVIDISQIKFYEGVLSGQLKANLNVRGIAYEIKNLKLAGFNAHPFSNSAVDTFLTKLSDYKDLRDKVYGTLDVSASLAGRGVEPSAIIKNLNGTADLTLKNGEIKRIKTLASIGEIIKSNTLKGDLKVGELTAKAGIGNGIVKFSKLSLNQQDLIFNFTGGIDLNKLSWVSGNRLTLKLSPSSTANLSKEYSLLRDKNGWLEATFEMTGSLKLPVPKPILDKPLENLKKKAQQQVQQAIDSQTEQLKKDAGEKIKNLLKF